MNVYSGPVNMSLQEQPGLKVILDDVRRTASGPKVRLKDILETTGRRSFCAVLLLIGLLTVSPLSAIPGLPAVFALVVLLICVQALFNRDMLWLPQRLTRIEIPSTRLLSALDRLERPVAWIDSKAHARFSMLTHWPLSAFAYLVIMLVALTWPPMALIPFSATLSAIGVTLIAAGLMLRDGIFVVSGYVFLGLIYGAGAYFISGFL